MAIRETWVDLSLRWVRAGVADAGPVLGFAVKWLFVSIVGVLGGAVAGGLVGGVVAIVWIVFGGLDGYDALGALALAVLGAMVGSVIGVGVAQWRLLRGERIRRAGWWVLAHTLGWAAGPAAGLSVALLVQHRLGVAVGLFVGFAVAGLVGGALQWLVLRRDFSRAARWVVASTISYALGGALVAGTAWLGSVITTLSPTMAMALVLATTGGALGWLLRQPVRETPAGRTVQ